MIDLRERMVRIETKLDIRVEKDAETDAAIAILTARTLAIEVQAIVLKTHITTLRWVGGLCVAFLGVFGSSLANLFNLTH
jgi:hypothetical protein